MHKIDMIMKNLEKKLCKLSKQAEKYKAEAEKAIKLEVKMNKKINKKG